MEVDIVEGQEEDKLTIDNTPTPDVLSKYRLAGNFCSIAIKSVLSQCVPGANCAELCRIGDVAILSQVQSFTRHSNNRLLRYIKNTKEESQTQRLLTSTIACALIPL